MQLELRVERLIVRRLHPSLQIGEGEVVLCSILMKKNDVRFRGEQGLQSLYPPRP